MTETPSKPKIEKAGSIWWVNWEVFFHGQIVQKAKPCASFPEAIAFVDSRTVPPVEEVPC